MFDTEWLNQLKVGDMVEVGFPFGQPPQKTKVMRTTKTLVIIHGKRSKHSKPYEIRFRRTDGSEVPSARDGRRLYKPEG